MKFGLVGACIVALSSISGDAFAECPSRNAVQVLGSGGPDASDARASAGYLVWIDGEARLLLDAGGGVFLRFGEAKAKFETLDAVAITHLHADHVADLVSLLKSGFFSQRDRPLPVIGPSGGGAFPSMSEYMTALLDSKRGAYRYLSGYLDGTGGMVKAEVNEMDATPGKTGSALENERVKVRAVGVTHGAVPALGYIVETKGKRVVFSGDQNGENSAFVAAVGAADVLIMDHAVPEAAGEVERNLHARPSEIGKLASALGVKRLILSHNMARSLESRDESLRRIRQHYQGEVLVAEDLVCLSLDD